MNPWLIGGSALLGGLAGAIPKRSSQTSTVDLPAASELEKYLSGNLTGGYKGLEELIGMGPGGSDVTAALESQRGLAGLLEQMQASGGMPSAEQIGQAQGYASDIFAPQRQQLQTDFSYQAEQANQLAAQLGRPINDPILRAKLARSQTEQSGQLAARQGAFAAEYANKLPYQTLDLAQSLANVRGGLASQAFANRQMLMTMGSQLLGGERNFRLGAANRTTTSKEGGGLGGFIGGALAGAGTGARVGSMFGGSGASGIADIPSTSNMNYTFGDATFGAGGPGAGMLGSRLYSAGAPGVGYMPGAGGTSSRGEVFGSFLSAR